MNGNNGNSSAAVSAANKGAEQTGKAQEKFSIGNRALHEYHEEKPTNEYVLNVAFFSFLGFTVVQTGFAIAANSAAMMQDSEAMFVDALTYLFNFLAERLKHRPYSEKEKRMPADLRHYRRRLHRLYLELIPPFISVATLMVVTIYALRDSIRILFRKHGQVTLENQPDINIMMLFSALNLGLDVVNVMCFARAHQAVGLHATSEIAGAHHHVESERDHGGGPTESTPLTATTILSHSPTQRTNETDSSLTDLTDDMSTESEGLNLNMCSAWTHVCADTFRSVAVLIAAAFAFLIPALTPVAADAFASFMVSIIIIVSLAPLIQGLYYTSLEIWEMSKGSEHPCEVTLTV